MVLVVALLLAAPVMAGTSEDPEIQDDKDDARVDHLQDDGLLAGGDDPDPQVEASGDIVRAWIGEETRDAFAIHVEVADLPPAEDVSSPLVELWTHFTIDDEGYHASATITSASSSAPLETGNELYRADTSLGAIPGTVEPADPSVALAVPKPEVGDPASGDQLTRLHVTSHEPQDHAPLDYAPGDNEDSLPTIGDTESADPRDLSLSSHASFGDTYTFGFLEDEEDPQSDDDASGSDKGEDGFTLETSTPSLEIPAGKQTLVNVTVTNDDQGSDELSLATPHLPSGWEALVEPRSLELSSYEAQTVTLGLTPPPDAEDAKTVQVQAVREDGVERTVTLSVSPIPEDGSPSTDETEDAGSGEDAAQDTSEGSTPAEDGREEDASPESLGDATDSETPLLDDGDDREISQDLDRDERQPSVDGLGSEAGEWPSVDAGPSVEEANRTPGANASDGEDEREDEGRYGEAQQVPFPSPLVLVVAIAAACALVGRRR